MLWLCVGDFNEITYHLEKHGVVLRPHHQMVAFKEVLEGCHLSDLGFIGSKFTWCNNRTDYQFTKERLDGVVANLRWREMFEEVDDFVL
jgi:hypothetical protein